MTENPYSHDYANVPEERKKFVVPHEASGSEIVEIASKDGEVKIPVAFHTEGDDFYITGLQPSTNEGGIISGKISVDAAKVNHIDLAKNFRNLKLGQAFLNSLEQALKKRNVKNAYAVFGRQGTIDFFLRNGYTVISLSALNENQKKELVIDPKDFQEIRNNEEYAEAIKIEGTLKRKLLMVKDLE